MALRDDLALEVSRIFGTVFTERKGRVIPTPDTVQIGNDAVRIEGTVLYADLSRSTHLVDTKQPWFAAKIYKTFLHCCAKIIRNFGGTITAYDGDRIMAVWLGETKNTNAVKAALAINFARLEIIQPALNAAYPKANYSIRHTCGVDTSPLFVTNTGIRGSKDLVWVGRAANWAAKLSDLPDTHATRISSAVYDVMMDKARISNKGVNMWERVTWRDMNNVSIYRSNFLWRF